MGKTLKEIINNKELLKELEEDKDNYLTIIKHDVCNNYLDLINYCYDTLEKVFLSPELKDKITQVEFTSRMKNSKSICSCFAKDQYGKILINSEHYRLDSAVFKLIHYVVGKCLIKFYNEYVDIVTKTSLYKEQEMGLDRKFIEDRTKSAVLKGIGIARNDDEVKIKIQHVNPNIDNKFAEINFPSREDFIKAAIDTALLIAQRRTKKNLTILDERGNTVL